MSNIPYNQETEIQVLSILLSHQDKVFDLLEKINGKHFQDTNISKLYEIIQTNVESGNPYDRRTLKTLISNHNDKTLSFIFGQAEIMYIPKDAIDISVNNLLENYTRRKFEFIGRTLMNKSADTSVSVSDLSELIENHLYDETHGKDQKTLITPSEASSNAMSLYLDRKEGKTEVGITFPSFPGVNECLAGGAIPGDCILIAAETGHGKTSTALNFVADVSIRQDHKTYYQNTEMAHEEMVFRCVSAMTGIPYGQVRRGKIEGSPAEVAQKEILLGQAFDKFKQSQVYLSELPELTPSSIKTLARKFKVREEKLDVLVIDYIGRVEMDGDTNKGMQEWQILYKVAKESKKLAQQLGCVVIILAQLTEGRQLEGAKKILNEMDLALFIDELDDKEKQTYPMATHKMIKRKCRRSDQNGDIYVRFLKPIQKMEEVYTSKIRG